MSDSLKVVGKLLKKFDTQQVSDNFSKREFVVQVGDNYPQLIKFELTQDKCGLLDRYEEGQEVEVGFNLRGREWNGKYFTNLQAWKIYAAQEQEQNSQGGPSLLKAAYRPTEPEAESDGLPF